MCSEQLFRVSTTGKTALHSDRPSASQGKPPQGKTDFGPHLGNAGRDGREGSLVGSSSLLRAERAGSGRDRAMFTACTPL